MAKTSTSKPLKKINTEEDAKTSKLASVTAGEKKELINYYKDKIGGLHLYGSDWDKIVTPMNAPFIKKLFLKSSTK